MLLPKREEIQRRKGEEQRTQIEQGMKIAHKVDSLRESLQKEEAAFKKFRDDSLRVIQSEIDPLIQEREALTTEVETLRTERIRLEAPIDLTEEWNRVQQNKEANDAHAEELLQREIEIIGRENVLFEESQRVTQRELVVTETEMSARENLIQAEEQRKEAVLANNSAQKLLSKTELHMAEQDAVSRAKTEELERKERNLTLREEQLERDVLDINSQKILLADRRATLERGFEELRRKTSR